MSRIHPTAIIEEGAQVADDVVLGPNAFVGSKVVVGPGCRLDHGAIIQGRTTLGAGNHLFPYSVLGSVPQDKKYEGEPARLVIGDRNAIREHVTLHIGTTHGGGVTVIGSDNLIMAGAHVGHDCQVGNHCVLANHTDLAGHVVVEDRVILGGQTGVHQFVRIGAHVITSGGSKVAQDVPPYMVTQGYPARLRGINHVGLQRNGFTDATIRILRRAYRAVFLNDEPRFELVLAQAREEFSASHEVGKLLDFIEVAMRSGRGTLRHGDRKLNGESSVDESEGPDKEVGA
ncbi:MAG: acyl-ACP--UDP-N-acetylglucosamine O-acyltransferase [Planctomycetes bacterium]|nr:acyl-ACP--UDP-N-acetylglucosamine O-acyltransferase [Planctomycetota bacterium]